MSVNYFHLIQKYIPVSTDTYQFFVPHSVLVTQKALAIAKRLALPADEQRFIEEASMLHDIGIIKVHAPDIGCHGELPYICHGTQGSLILESEGLLMHARVAKRHTGVGLTIADIEHANLPLPKEDMVPESLSEEIICYADKWYSKNPNKLWQPYTYEEIVAHMTKLNDAQHKIQKFEQWKKDFGE